jgi:hypothetical protein
LSGPELSASVSATFRKRSGGQPVTRSTISGVYREKCRRTIWKTHWGCWSVGSISGGGFRND